MQAINGANITRRRSILEPRSILGLPEASGRRPRTPLSISTAIPLALQQRIRALLLIELPQFSGS
jgi:hypothetical protein